MATSDGVRDVWVAKWAQDNAGRKIDYALLNAAIDAAWAEAYRAGKVAGILTARDECRAVSDHYDRLGKFERQKGANQCSARITALAAKEEA